MPESQPVSAPKLLSVDRVADGQAEAAVVGVGDDRRLPPTLKSIDESGGGWISRAVERGAVRGKPGEVNLWVNPSADGPAMLLVMGLGAQSDRTREKAFETASAAIRKLSDRSRSQVNLAIAESFPETTHDAIVSGAIYGCEGQAIYQSEPSSYVPETIGFAGIVDGLIDRGRHIGDGVNQTRRLVNEPAGIVYPESFARRAEELAREVGLEVEIWDESKLADEGCRAILAVGRGSTRPPRLLIIRYSGGGNETPLALVGKGVTFDSGGLSLKPSDSMIDMKCDMAGAASVVGAMRTIAKLGIRRNVVGLCGLAENMVSGDSYKLGDVIETRSGKTIEILNTDAEGRVVLADVLDVAVQQRPAAIVDLATLTGSCMVALGNEVAGLMTNNQSLYSEFASAAQIEGEPVWQLPMFELYNEKVKSKVADIKNVGEGRWGGAITAAKFLENFVDDVPWLHIDIAGPAFAESPLPHRDAGATGCLVRSLVRWVQSKQASHVGSSIAV